MEKFTKSLNGIHITSDYFCPFATLECGQLFRFYKNNGVYTVISGDKKCSILSVSQSSLPNSDQKSFSSTTIITNHPDYFFDYFDLSTDYADIYQRLGRFDELKDKISGCGIHILRQDLFEAIISFIISANNNIPRIQGIIERLAQSYGEQKDGYFAFPTADRLKDVSAADYKRLGAGYRAEYLQSTVRKVLDTDVLNQLKNQDYLAATKTLLTLKGVGRKVADCVSLFALKHTCCYPADTWISKADGLSADAARKRGMDRYGDLAGYAQQVIFHSARNLTKK